MKNAVLFDYLSYTFTFQKINDITGQNIIYEEIEPYEHPFVTQLISLLGFQEEEISHFDYGRNRFASKIVLGENITLLFNGSKDSEGNEYHMLEMTGSGCLEFSKRNGNWFNLLDYLVSNGGFHFTRLDLAIDLIDNPRITVEWVLGKLQKREMITPFNSYRYVGSDNLKKADIVESGLTVYLGSSASNKNVVIYDKLRERADRADEEYMVNQWVRFEIRLFKESADSVVNDLLKGSIDELGVYTMSMLNHLIEFKNKGVDISRKKEWETNRHWKRFIGTAKQFKFENTYKNQKSSIKKRKTWIEKNVSRSLIGILASSETKDINKSITSLLVQKVKDINAVDMAMINKERKEKGLDEYNNVDELKKEVYERISETRSKEDFSDIGLDDLEI